FNAGDAKWFRRIARTRIAGNKPSAVPFQALPKGNATPATATMRRLPSAAVVAAEQAPSERERNMLVEPGFGKGAIAEPEEAAQVDRLRPLRLQVEEGTPAGGADHLQRVVVVDGSPRGRDDGFHGI